MKIKAILINAVERTVSQVEIAPSLEEYYRLLNCDCITTAPVFVSTSDTLYVDDEGLLKDPKYFFHIHGETYAGNGLIVGGNDFGEDVSVSATLGQIRSMVSFLRAH